MKKIIPIMLVLLISFSVFALATNCPPSPPKTYYGTVSYDDDLLPGVFEIRAVMGSDTVGIGEVSEGDYEIDVSPCSETTGNVIFYINGIETNEGGSYDGMGDWGKIEDLDLTVNDMPSASLTCGDGIIQSGEECDGTNLAGRDVNNCGVGWVGTISCSSTCEIDYSNCTTPFCGDNSCNNDETCSTCPEDCDACPSNDDDDYLPPSDGGGSSGGGGGDGGGSSSSSSSSSTTVATSEDGLITIAAVDDTQDDEDETVSSDKIQEATGPGITGGVIGFMKSGVGIGLIFSVFILIIGIGVIMFRNKSSKKE